MAGTTDPFIHSGGITSPLGFSAGGAYVGIKTYGEVEGRLDVAVLASDRPCNAAAVFTKNSIPGAPVTVSREHLVDGMARGIVANSGCSNVAMGDVGIRDARRMAKLAADQVGCDEREMLVASTGVIGRPLPMDRIERGIVESRLDGAGGNAFARAIMTTDTVAKERAASATIDGVEVTVGGVAKGSGMVHPDMATVFCFMTTDANVPIELLRPLLKRVADRSINMVDVDMDTSTSDTMALLANGAAGGAAIVEGSQAAQQLEGLLNQVAIELARDLARDGEGAKTLIEVKVEGAATVEDARSAARTVVSSPLVKTMVTGRDPNLGRVMMALGRSGARVDVAKTSIFIFDVCAFRNGTPSEVDYPALSAAMHVPEVQLRVNLGLGEGAAVAWGCDLTERYVRINADYTT